MMKHISNFLPDLEKETRRVQVWQVSMSNNVLGFLIDQEQMDEFWKSHEGITEFEFSDNEFYTFKDHKGRETTVNVKHIVGFYQVTDN